MALSDSALTTVAAVETELGLAPGSEPRIEGWIEDASEAIAEYIGRPLHYSASITENHAGDGGDSLLLRRRPVVSVTGTSHAGAALAVDAVEIEDADAGALRFLGGLSNDDGAVYPGVSQDVIVGSARRLYSVTYAGGWVTPAQAVALGLPVTLPRVLQRACVAAVAWMRANPGGGADSSSIASESLLGYSVSYRDVGAQLSSGGGSVGLPASVCAMLDRFVDVAMSG